MNKTFIYGGIIIAIILSVVGLVGGHQSASTSPLRGSSNFDILSAAGLQIGSGCDDAGLTCTGTALTLIKSGTPSSCTASSTITASQTGRQECAITGLLSTDTVLSSQGEALSSTYLRLGSAYASTTVNGYLEIPLGNASSTASVTSVQNDVRNVKYFILR